LWNIAGERVIYVPITLFAVINGERVRDSEVTVYYLCIDGAHNYINKTLQAKYTEEPMLRTQAEGEAGKAILMTITP